MESEARTALVFGSGRKLNQWESQPRTAAPQVASLILISVTVVVPSCGEKINIGRSLTLDLNVVKHFV